MKYQSLAVGAAALTLAVATATTGLAQTAVDNAPAAPAQPYTATPGTLPPAQGEAIPTAGKTDRAGGAYTLGIQNAGQPAERAPKGVNPRRKQMEQSLRGQWAAFGFAGEDTQNALLTYIRKEERARWPIKNSAQRMVQCLTPGTAPTSTVALNAAPAPLADDPARDEQIRAAITDFRAALEKDKARRQAAEAALDAQIGYSKHPRLEAMLILFGLIGDTQVVVVPAPPPPPAAINPLPVPAVPATAMAPALNVAMPTGGAGAVGGTIGRVDAGFSSTSVHVLAKSSSSFFNFGGLAGEQNRVLFQGYDPFASELHQELMRRFDKNGDNRLDANEQAQAMRYLRAALNAPGSDNVIMVAPLDGTTTQAVASVNPKEPKTQR
ncbi:MAG: hypothetical protein JO316_15875 [Abitibacteriaceae bacterium]|nr:hypothetical protein [Abditibacteriaceae bacterium]